MYPAFLKLSNKIGWQSLGKAQKVEKKEKLDEKQKEIHSKKKSSRNRKMEGRKL